MRLARSAGRAWRAFWFPAIPIRRLAVFRIIVCAYVVYDLLIESRWMARYATVSEEFYAPILVMRTLGLPRLGPEALSAVRVLLIVAGLFALIGICTRLALWLAASLYLFWFATFNSYQVVSDPKLAMTFALFVLAVAPSGRAYSMDALLDGRWTHRPPAVENNELAGWAFQVLTVLLLCIYGFAAFNKLRLTGPDWWTSGSFERVILDFGTPTARYLAEHHLWLVDGLALLVLAFEMCAPVLLFRTPLRKLYAGFAIMFHLGTLALLNINFLDFAVVCMVVFDLERIPVVLAFGLRSLRGSPGLPGPRPLTKEGRGKSSRATGFGAAAIVSVLVVGLFLAGRNPDAFPGTYPVEAEQTAAGGDFVGGTVSDRATPESPRPGTDPPAQRRR